MVPLVLVGSSRPASANNKTCIWNAGSNGTAFNTSGAWSNCEGGPTFTGPPSGNDTAVFNGTSTKTCTISGQSLGSVAIQVNSGYTGTLTFSTSGSNFASLSVAAGTVTVSTGLTVGSVSITGGLVNGASPITVGGSFSNATSATFTNSGTLTLNGSGTPGLTPGGATFSALTISGSGVYAETGTLAVTGALTVTSGGLNAGAATVNLGSASLMGGVFTASSGTTTVSGAFNNSSSTTFANNNGTLKLTGSATFTTGGATYNALTITGTYSLSGNLTASGALTVSSGALNAGANTVSVGSASLTGGTFTASSATTTVAGAFSNASSSTFANNGGTLKLTGSGTFTTGGATFAAVTVSGSGTYTLSGNLSVTGALSVTSGGLSAGANAVGVGSASLTGGTFTASSATTTVGGGFSNASSSTFANNGGTVSLTGTGTLTTGGATFSTLTSSGTYTVSGTLTVSNTLTVSAGGLNAGSNTVSVGALSVTGGTFTASSGTTTVNGAFSNASSSSFASNSGTVALGGSGSLNLTTGGASFTTLNVTGTATYTLQDNLSVNGTLTVSAGTLACGAKTVSLGGLSVAGGTFSATTTTTTINGSFSHSSGTFAANGGVVALAGSGSVTSGGTTFATLNVAASGTYTLSDALSTGTLNVSAGTLTAGSNAVTITGNLNLSAGTFNASSGTTTLTGNFNKTGGTFGANNGTFYFNGITNTMAHTFGGAVLGDVQVGLSTSGLISYWKLDEASGTSIADSAGSNTGVLSGSTPSRTASIASKISFSDPEALTLGGAVVSLGVTNLPANNAPQTISLWFQGTPDGNNHNMIAMSALGSGSAVQLGFRGANLIAWNYGGGTLVSMTAPVDGAWHQVIYTYDGSTDSIYLDGVLGATNAGTHQTGTPTTAYLGTYDGGSELFTGTLDDVRVYNRAISAAEIAILSGGSSPSTIAGVHTFNDAFACSGDFDLLAGQVKGSSSLSVGGNWFNAGTYTDTGAVTLTGTSSSLTLTTGGASLGALTINGSGGTYTLQDNLSVTGSLTIGSGAGLAGSKSITVGGDWTNAGAYSDVGLVTLTSSSAAASITSGGGHFSALTINGTGTYTIQDRLWVPSGTITLTNGTLKNVSSIVHVGSFSFGSGSYLPGSGTVVFDGTASQSLPASISTWGGLRFEDPAETGLVGYWKLDESQGRVIQDLSGNGNTGALSASGVTWLTGASIPSTISFDNYAAASFDGSSGYAQLGANNMPATDAAVTISAWVKFSSNAGNQNMVALVGSGGNYLQLGTRAGVYTAWPAGASSVVTGPAADTGVWHHVAYTYDGGTVDTIYVDGVAYTGSFTHQSGATTSAYLGTYTPANELLNGALDDVRIYNVALTAAQVKQLAAGRYAGTGGYATTTLSTNTTVTGILALDAGNLDANGKTMTAGASGPTTAFVSSGTYTVGNAAQAFNGGLTVQPGGTLTLASSGGSVQIGSGQVLTIDGTLKASSTGATIQGISAASYTFKVGSTASATPTLAISGLAVQNTNGGMQIGATTAATTTITQFDNIAFSGGTGGQYVLLDATSLFLSSSGCTFDSGSPTGGPTVAVTAAGDGTGNGETRAVFGGTKCATNWAISASDTTCTTTAKSDDDSDNNGVADSATSGTNGAVVEFVRSAADDTAGTIVGFPTAGFDWNSFSYYSTYAAFNNASGGTTAVVYVRDESGNPLYSWVDPTANETITGTPQWISSTVAGVTTHYLYVSVNGSASNTGKVYRLKDTGTGTASGTLTLDTSWPTATSTGFYACSCTITSDLQIDANNVYWAATTAGPTQTLQGIAQSSGAKISASWPVTTPASVNASSPTLFTDSGTTTLYMGLSSGVASLAVTGTTFVQDTKPGTVTGRISVGTSFLAATSGTKRIYAGDSAGNMTAISPSGFTGTTYLWQYAASTAITNNYYDAQTDTVQFGTAGGTIVALNAAGSGTGGSLVNTSYPFTLNASDPITAAPLYVNGVLAVGTTLGKLYFLDRNTGNATAPNGVKIIKEYYFGPTESVSTIGYDSTVNRFMVATSSAAKDGRLYYFDAVTDPTSGSL